MRYNIFLNIFITIYNMMNPQELLNNVFLHEKYFNELCSIPPYKNAKKFIENYLKKIQI